MTLAGSLHIREATEEDWPSIWPIVQDVAAQEETFAYDPDLSEADARALWQLDAPARVVVAVVDGKVVGTANMYANRAGPGSHVASGSLMVDSAVRGRGIGRALVIDMIEWARRAGFTAVQYNAVVETNTAAVELYVGLGFTIIGTVPGAFRHPVHGPVGLHILWLDLQQPT